jgi:hypothetical protein
MGELDRSDLLIEGTSDEVPARDFGDWLGWRRGGNSPRRLRVESSEKPDRSFRARKETTMTAFFAAASPAAWLLLVLAAVTLWHSIRYLRNLRLEHLVAASSAALGSLLLGALAFAVGVQTSVSSLRPDTGPVLALFGAAESLSCLLLALVTCLVAALLLSIGGYRSLRAVRGATEPRSSEAPSRA